MNGISRRSLVKAFPFIGASIALPTASLAADENITDRLERLTQDLSAAMAEYHGGQFKVIVEPGSDGDVTFVRMGTEGKFDLQAWLDSQAPRGRANYHLSQLASALYAMNPGQWMTSSTPNMDGELPEFVMINRATDQKAKAGVWVQYV